MDKRLTGASIIDEPLQEVYGSMFKLFVYMLPFSGQFYI